MKRLNYFLIALTILSTNAFSQDALSEQKEYFDARQNPSKWDMEMLKVDLEDDGLEEPMNYGAFPVGKYDTSSSFKGLGNMMYPGVQGYYKSIDRRSCTTLSSSIRMI